MNRDKRSNTSYTPHPGVASRQQGVSLVELMIGLLIGLVLLGGVLQTMLASREASTARQSMSTITDNARFLFEFLGRDLRMAGRGCDDDPLELSCSSNDVSDNGILEVDLTNDALKAAYMDPDSNKVVVEFGYDAADKVITYKRNGGNAEPLVDRIEGFEVAFGTYDDGANSITYSQYTDLSAGTSNFPASVDEVISLRFKVEFENATAVDFEFDSPVIVSTVALRNRVAKLIN